MGAAIADVNRWTLRADSYVNLPQLGIRIWVIFFGSRSAVVGRDGVSTYVGTAIEGIVPTLTVCYLRDSGRKQL